MASTLTQKRALALVPKASGALSFVGSVFIITDILRSKEKMSRTYSRILLVMSLFDFSTSIAQALSTWPIPTDSGALYAVGNEMTCNAQGFFTQLGVGAPMMNCSLSFYYLFVIAFPLMSEARLRQAEWTLHGVPVTIAFSTAIMGIPLTLYNNSGLWCWISSLPGTCGNDPSGTGDCIRGDNAWVYRWAIYYAPVWFCVITITVNMAVVSYFVWSSERKHALEMNAAGSTVNNNNNNSDTAEDDDQEIDPALPKKPMDDQSNATSSTRGGLTNQVFWQAFYYVLAFYVTWIFPTALRLLQTLGQPVPYYIILLMAILLPLQGFFNFLVYVRPRVVLYHQNSPGTGVWSAIGQAVQKTVSFVPRGSATKSEHGEEEIRDVQALDPCYAMQIDRERKKAAREKRAAAKAAVSERGSGAPSQRY